MNSKDILLRAAGLIEKKGLAIEAGMKNGSVCTAVALVESAYEHKAGKKALHFNDKEYVIARNVLCGLLGINSSYHAVAEWNDDFRTDKVGNKTYKRTKDEVVITLRKAAELAQEPVKISSHKSK